MLDYITKHRHSIKIRTFYSVLATVTTWKKFANTIQIDVVVYIYLAHNICLNLQNISPTASTLCPLPR